MHSQYNTIITIIIAMHTPGELFISLCVCDCELSDGALYIREALCTVQLFAIMRL